MRMDGRIIVRMKLRERLLKLNGADKYAPRETAVFLYNSSRYLKKQVGKLRNDMVGDLKAQICCK